MVATLFDFNGVLVDDENVHLAAFRETLLPLGITISDDEYVERYLGFDDAGAFRAILADHGKPVSEERVAELIEQKKPLYMRRAERELIVFDGAAEALRACASRGPVGIVSGALRHEIAFALEKMGIASLVSFVVSAEDTAHGKPDPEGYRLGLRALESIARTATVEPTESSSGQDPVAFNVTRIEIIVVEDSLAGIEAARGAGLDSVAVAHSYQADALARAGARWVVPSIASVNERWLDEVGHGVR